MIQWIYYPLYSNIPPHLSNIVDVFRKHSEDICSSDHPKLESDKVLSIVRDDLQKLGYLMEEGKKKGDKIRIPVLYAMNGEEAVVYEVDGFDPLTKTVVEIESGRAISNYQVLKDLVESCLMDVDYLCIALRMLYRQSKDFEKFNNIIDAIYKSNRLNIPLKGLLIIGY